MGWLGMRVPPDRAKDHHDPRSATTPAAATIRAIADPASRDPAGPWPPAGARGRVRMRVEPGVSRASRFTTPNSAHVKKTSFESVSA